MREHAENVLNEENLDTVVTDWGDLEENLRLYVPALQARPATKLLHLGMATYDSCGSGTLRQRS